MTLLLFDIAVNSLTLIAVIVGFFRQNQHLIAMITSIVHRFSKN